MRKEQASAAILALSLALMLPAHLAQAENHTTGASALVESIEGAPDAGIGFLDYVYPDQVIDLGPSGVIVLSYFDSCLLETVRGGQVTVEVGASKVTDGTVSIEKMPCQGTKMFVTVDTSEAGVTVHRISEEGQDDWFEWTVKSTRPTFKWRPASQAGASEIRVHDMDAEAPNLIWQGQAETSYMEYPATAPDLRIGYPYLVSVELADGSEFSVLFSIDPDLEVPDTAVSRLVPLRRVAAP